MTVQCFTIAVQTFTRTVWSFTMAVQTFTRTEQKFTMTVQRMTRPEQEIDNLQLIIDNEIYCYVDVH